MKSFSFEENRSLSGGLFPCLLLCFIIASAGPLWDIDLWWHLASGRYIVQHQALFNLDPFCFTSPDQGLSPMMNAYWLSQVLFSLVFGLFGPYGMIAARVILLSLVLSGICLLARRRGASVSGTVIVLALAGWTALTFTGERPQLFSFFLAPVVVFIFDSIMGGLRKEGLLRPLPLAFLCATMILWANLHGGFIMGTALIGLCFLSELGRLLLSGKPDLKRLLRLVSAALLPVSASLINPNTYKMYLVLLQMETNPGKRKISEYVSPVTLLVKDGFSFPAYWMYFSLFLLVFVLYARKIEKNHLLISVFLALLSLSSVRYVPFFVFVTAPLTAWYLTGLIAGRPLWRSLVQKTAWLTVPVVLAGTAAGFSGSTGETLKSPIKAYRFPVEASVFLRQHAVPANIFNHWNWGGYLEWTIFPAQKIFIDGRVSDPRVFQDYTYMLWDETRMAGLFDRYGIRTIILPALNPITGELYRLVEFLAADQDWHLVFSDESALVFVRGEQNVDIIRDFSMPKRRVWDHVTEQARHILDANPKAEHALRALNRAARK